MNAPHQSLISMLNTILPSGCLLWQKEDTAPYECDGLAAYRMIPLAVALPENESQVQAVLKACHAAGVPVVPRGAGTGLSGGAMPMAEGIVLSTAKLNKIVAVDPLSRRAVLQPGVRNLAISDAANPYGLYYAPDPSSQIACSIGGNVAENSGGVHCLKYGLTVNNVIKVRAVLMDGEIVEFSTEALDAPGLDLLGVMIGSEGMLAVVTEVTVRLIPKPPVARVIMASFDDMGKAGKAVADVIAAGLIPAGLEMMDKPATRAVEEFVHAGYDLEAEAILLCESDGTAEEVEEEIGRMSAVLRESGAIRIQVSESEAERMRFWSGRKNAFPAAGRISPDYYCMDGTIPKKHIATLLNQIKAMEGRYGLRCMNVFHAGDGNMHPLILFDGSDADQWHRAEDFGNEILEACVALGGTVTGEHGVGIEKINTMCVQFNEKECDAMIKHYGEVLAHDPRYAEKAARISAMARDVSEILPEFTDQIRSLVQARGQSNLPQRVTYHPPCTLQHAQKIRGPVEDLLTQLGVTVKLCQDSHICCGSAGTYAILQPEMSQTLLARKLDHLHKTDPEEIVSANVGCINHLQSGTDVPVRHWVELIDRMI